MMGTIFDIKEMAVHDGPGLRTTVFLKGCPLRCIWCHNPEGLSTSPQLMHKAVRCTGCMACHTPCNHPQCQAFGRCAFICPENCLEITGYTTSSDDLARELIASAKVLGTHFGGFTFSGGEPLAQPEFLLSLLGQLQDYNLCIETSGFASGDVFRAVTEKLDFVIMDIKLFDSQLHKQYTGQNNRCILDNFKYLKSCGKPHLIRTPLIPGITDTDENLSTIRQLIGDSPWEQLPYNPLAGAKYPMLGMEYLL